jgi:CRP/FNR family transcriptional regulator
MRFNLRDVPFFSSLSDESFRKLDNISYFKNYEAGELVFYEGDDPDKLHILMDGILRLYKTDPKGHEIYIHQFIPVSFVGELANFENILFPATAKFMTSGTMLKIDYPKLEGMLFENPDVSMEIIKSLTQKVKILSEVIHHEMILTSEAKVAKLIYEHSELFEQLKNNQIASILNVSPETLSRTLAKLKKQGIIAVDNRHHIAILDETALHSLF